VNELSLTRGTPIARQEFINQRRVLFTTLDTQLESIARWGTGLHKKGPLKKMLGLSTKSYLRTGEIQGYAARIGKIAKVEKLLRHGTPVGIGLNAISAGLEIKEACSVGRTEMCTRAKYVETGKFVTGAMGGMLVGSLSASTFAPICITVLGAATGGPGALGCGVLAGAIGGFGGGWIGETVGESMGEIIYQWTP
jgi:hypothetical protein